MKQRLNDAIDSYHSFRHTQDYSRNTLRVDRQVLDRFMAVNGNLWCHSITEKHVERHFESAARTRQNATLKNDHGVLTRFFKWGRKTGRMPVDSDPMYGRRQPKSVKKERNRIPVSDFPRLLDVAEAVDPRDRALCALLLYTLGRDSDIRTLRVRNLDLQENWLTMSIPKSRVEDRMPVSLELAEEMRKWLTYYPQALGRPLEPGDCLLPSRSPRPVNCPDTGRILRHESHYRPHAPIAATGRVVNPILARMGFPVRDENGDSLREGAHTIRRSGARALFDDLSANGYDHALRIVQSVLHHASVTQTEQYLGITADRRTRDEILRGRRMYSHAEGGSIIRLAK